MHPGSSVSQKENSISRDGLSASSMMISDKTSSSSVLIKTKNSPSSKPPKRSRSSSPSFVGVSLGSYRRLGSLGPERGGKLQKIDSITNKDKLSNGYWSSCDVRKSSNASVDKLKLEISKKKDSGEAKNLEKRRAALVEDTEEQPKELDCEIKLFTDTPEVHPSYENCYTSFPEYYEKEYSGSIDEAYFEKQWNAFWSLAKTEFRTEEHKTEKKCENGIAETGYLKSQDEKQKKNLSQEINTIKKDLPLSEGENIDHEDLLKLEPSSFPQSECKIEIVERLLYPVYRAEGVVKSWEDKTEAEYKVKLEKKCGSLNAVKGCIESQNENQESVLLPVIENIKREVLSLSNEDENVDPEGLLQLNPSFYKVEKNSYDEKETKFQKVCNQSECFESESSTMVVPWWMYSVAILSDACALLSPLLSSLLKTLFRKLVELGTDRSNVYQLLVERDSEFILSAVSEELEKMESNSGLDCHKLKLACLQALKLLRYPRFALQVQEKHAMKRDEKKVSSQRLSIESQGTLGRFRFLKFAPNKTLGCEESSQLSTNNIIEKGKRIKLVTSKTSHKEMMHSKEPNTEKSNEELFSELYCSQDSLVLLEEMESNVELMDSVASVLICDIRTCWSDRSKLWEILGDIECQIILIHVLDRANVLAENTPNAHDSERIYRIIVLTNKLLELSRAITSKMDHTLKRESSQVGFGSHFSGILHSQAEISSPYSLQISPNPSPPSVFSDSSLPTFFPSPLQPPTFSSNSVTIELSNYSPPAQFSSPSSQLRSTNFSPPKNIKGSPSGCENSNTSKDERQILTSIGHSISSKHLGLDHVRSSDGTASHGLHQDISITDKEFLSLEEVFSHIDLLGPIALTLLKEIHVCWPDKAQVSDVLLDDDKQVLLELMSVKLKEMTEEATTELCKSKYQVACITISKLQDLRKSCTQKPKYFGLDLSKIARMTFNKGSLYTTQYIKSALFIEGIVNSSNEDLTRIFKAVSDLHFTMAVT